MMQWPIVILRQATDPFQDTRDAVPKTKRERFISYSSLFCFWITLVFVGMDRKRKLLSITRLGH